MDSKMGEWEQNMMISELTQGMELARLLQIQLTTTQSSSSSSSHDQSRAVLLVQKIISSFEKALSMLNWSSSPSSAQVPQLTGLMIESPPSLTESPRSDQDSDRDSKDPQDLKDGSKKRKTFPRWTQRVRVSPGAGLEGPLDDGFSWRKYGQKDILGAKFPRGYYRCTHRNGKGCVATKQVQKSDEDPTIFEVTYRGNHTCAQQDSKSIIFSPTTQPDDETHQEPTSTTIEPQQPNFYETQQQQQQPEQVLLNLKKGLKVVTQELDIINPQHQSSSSSFPSLFHFSSPSPSHLPSPSASLSMVVNSNFTGNLSPSFISPQASGSTSNYNFSNNFQGNQTELNDIIISSGAATTTTSSTNSLTAGLDFPFGDIAYDSNFTFDNLGLFSSFHTFDKQTK